MSTLWSKAFWQAAGERSAKTFAQTLAAVMTADGLGLLDADWTARLSAAAGATLLSVLFSVASVGAGNPGPSLATETVEPELPAPGGAGGSTTFGNTSSPEFGG